MSSNRGKANIKKKNKEIPLAVIKRLPVYHRYLNELSRREVERISSQELAARIGITASQLRQDLSWFGSFGQQGYGYRVADLLREIGRILGLNHNTKMVLVGAGNLGRAIAAYPNLGKRGFQITAIFDSSTEIIGKTVAGVTVRDIKEMSGYLKENQIQIGVITTPSIVAQELAELLVQGGIKGIWNFAPVALEVPADVVVEHVHISESLLTLSFRLKQVEEFNNR